MFSFTVLEGLDDLCSMVKENPFLERKVQSEGYRDHKGFIDSEMYLIVILMV